MNSIKKDLQSLLKFLVIYQALKVQKTAKTFESLKNRSVDILMLKRGRFQKAVWHSSIIGLASVAVLTSGAVNGNQIVASTLPGINQDDPHFIQTFDPFAQGISLGSLVNLKTSVSSKPRSGIVEYKVKSGDTVIGIADKYGITPETIQWENDLKTLDEIKPGDTLRILPVSGVAVTVKSGDSLESLAKKYSANSQAILDFPFNDVPDDLHLTIGQTLYIPDGTPPEVAAPPKPQQPQYLAGPAGPTGPAFTAPNGGNFIWPTSFVYISTYFAWWHPGIDLPNPASPPVKAADSGVVTVAGWPDNYGYGNRVQIDHGNGYSTIYAHLANIYVTAGQHVSQGQVIGQMGSTGRSTGTHLHFEIHFKGVAVNPLAILK